MQCAEFANADEMARVLGDMVNSGWHLTYDAAVHVTMLHRTIQDMLVRFCIWILRAIGSQDFYDERNKRAVQFCKRFSEWANNDEYAQFVK